MMSQKTSYCHKDRPRKQCITPKKLKNKCLRRGRCLMWHFRVANDVGKTTHHHVMHSPRQHQGMTRQKPRNPRHLSLDPRGNPRQQGNEWKNIRRGTARKKLAWRGVQVPSTCLFVDILEHHFFSDVTEKRAKIGHVFTCPNCVFSLLDMTDFRWRPIRELPCQSELARPFFLTSQKTTFSYSVGGLPLSTTRSFRL